MRAATIRDGEVLVEEHPDPEPGAGEVLVRVRAAGINGADILQRKGGYPAPPGAPPDIPGLELAVVHERAASPVPDALDWPQAGGAPEVFTTAHDALFTQAELKAGERLLVHGGAGGVGTAAIQLGCATGADVTATVRNDALRGAVAELGATVVAPEGFADQGPYDVVLELIGAPNLPDDLNALATGGRVAVIGVGAGFKAELNLLALMGKRGRIHGSTLRARALEEKAQAARLVERHVLPLFETGALRVPVAETFPLDEVAAAYERFSAGGKLGKIVLLP